MTVARQQAVHLPNTDGQDRRPRHHIPPTSENLTQRFDPLQLPSTHRHQTHPDRTFKLDREVTFLLESYTPCCCKAILSLLLQNGSVIIMRGNRRAVRNVGTAALWRVPLGRHSVAVVLLGL